MQNLTLTDLIKSVARRPLWFAVPLVLCAAAAWWAVRSMQPVYRATTLVAVEKQKVPADYVKATVTTDVDERLRTMEQRITNRDHLERIISELNLYPEARRSEPIEKVVDDMRDSDLAVQRQGEVIRIYYKSGDPKQAAAVANRVAELFIQENLLVRAGQAQGTSAFLERELDATKVKLEQQEAKIAAFKQSFMGQLPEQRDTNLQGVAQLQAKLEITVDALDKAETRKIFLQRQIADLQQQQQAQAMGVIAPAAPGAPAAPSRLDQLRTELLDLRARYTDRHPDVIRVKSEIARLEALQSEAAAHAAAAPPPAPSPAPNTARAPRVDPVLRGQLDAVDVEIHSLQNERQHILDDIARYQARLESIPRVEQQLLALTRDYDNIKKSYDELLTKRIDARLAENLEKSRQMGQFTILERAVPPTDPYAPNPLLFLAGGLAFGALLGLTAATLREQTDATYVDGEALQAAFPGVPVLATIPIFSGNATAPTDLRAAARRLRRA